MEVDDLIFQFTRGKKLYIYPVYELPCTGVRRILVKGGSRRVSLLQAAAWLELKIPDP
jgi:hypothetical protein